ncbi:hypothetical protein KIH74_03410 [Kineosporia sp. J2-2]|uniref:Nucleotidyltransferase AbiEii toxin of type IV toxin-antitoxin system n=1 Tax=Kineosporia corallincola TaxID=2835133 RepID=A0ABS5TA80_9ACTN|nr:hypothetical protein [Kineosporia corallincola]MBT0767955.1 hypothetical protein [Kineosporia corallincola]
MDLHEKLDDGWTLVGGQMVHLHCAEAGHAPTRPTNDVDTVIDVRARPNMLQIFTRVLVGLGFSGAGISAEGIQHRWVRGEATIDVLLPDGVGEKAALRTGVTASPTIPTPGGTQALDRSDSVAVSVAGREGFVRRPTLVGALIMKAAAHSAVGDPAKGRHRSDFVTLASLIAARDFRGVELTKKDRQRLKGMIAAVRADAQVMAGIEDAVGTLIRLERVSG